MTLAPAVVEWNFHNSYKTWNAPDDGHKIIFYVGLKCDFNARTQKLIIHTHVRSRAVGTLNLLLFLFASCMLGRTKLLSSCILGLFHICILCFSSWFWKNVDGQNEPYWRATVGAFHQLLSWLLFSHTIQWIAYVVGISGVRVRLHLYAVILFLFL